ncbi:PAS domain-containing protein [Shinella sp. HZN7]|uniref:PAS domain-containing protein n=1 Tax=Shinella sp. (strain HZN7) TaxID=879274 RepID=UPI000A029C21|nr:PAS domain-containing protein [Shinella sp. HZN7]
MEGHSTYKQTRTAMPAKPPNFVSSRHYIEMVERFTSIGFWNADMATGAIRATRGFFKAMGLAPDEGFSLGTWISLVHPDDQEDFRSIFPLARTGMPVSREVRLVHADRASRWIRVDIDQVKQNDGPQDLVVGVVEDVTRERRSRAAVVRERARLEALVRMTGEIFWVADASGSILDLKGWKEITGQSEAEICGGGWAEAIHSEDRQRVVEEWSSSIGAASPYTVSYRLRYRDGE